MKMPPFSLPGLLLVAACTPAPAPVAPTPAVHATHAEHHEAASPAPAVVEHTATANVAGAFGKGTPVTVTLHVRDASGAPMGPSRFQLVHEHQLHVLIVDPSLSDYSHAHPEPLGESGDWRFVFIPRHDRPYHLWLDATPVGGPQHYALVTVNQAGEMAMVQRVLATKSRIGDLEASLSFDGTPRAGEMVAARIVLTRGGKPMTALEPVMGAYAHIVGISEDWQHVAHVHPLGAGPHAPGDRGGPDLRFHLEPSQPGYLALFAQVRVGGKDLILPFGIEVQPAQSSEPMKR